MLSILGIEIIKFYCNWSKKKKKKLPWQDVQKDIQELFFY